MNCKQVNTPSIHDFFFHLNIVQLLKRINLFIMHLIQGKKKKIQMTYEIFLLIRQIFSQIK
jgi:hypothetical protein